MSTDPPAAPPPSSLSILKPTSAYETSTESTDSQFFPSEPAPPLSSVPIPQSIDPQEDDYDDPDGAVFSGPAARSVPTSTSTFRMKNRTRGEMERQSRELSRSRSEVNLESGDEDDGRSLGGKSRRSRRSSRRSTRSRRGSDATATATDGEDLISGAESTRSTSRRRRSSHKKSSSAYLRRRASRPPSPTSSDDEDASRSGGFFAGISNALRGRPSFSRQESGTSSRAGSTRRPSRVPRRSSDYSADEDAISIRSESEFGGGTSEAGHHTEGIGGEDESEDPYGPYGSSDSNSTTTTFSSSSSAEDGPRRRRGGGGGGGGGGMFGLPGTGGGGDAMFGESRIDFDDDGSGGEGDDDDLSTLDGDGDGRGKGSPNAHQSIYIPDEDLPLRFVGLSLSKVKLVLWGVGCVMSFGILWLLGRWLPRLWLRTVGKPGEFDQASYIVVETFHHDSQILPIQTLTLPRPVPLSSLFPPSLTTPPAHRDDVSHPSYAPHATSDSASIASGTSINPTSSNAVPVYNPLAGIPPQNAPVTVLGGGNANNVNGKKKNGIGNGVNGSNALVDSVKFVDYRYYRFLLHPSGEFRMVREWKDPLWTSIPSLRSGLSSNDSNLRTAFFGSNAIEIQARTLGQLLMDEVLHPFYVFQIFSIVLWAFDDYYYYAFAIAVISIGSIVQTLIETKQNVERMREMSRFSCPVKVLRDSDWVDLDSSALLPGDIVDLSPTSLTTFPADLILLSGDAIVNESMLTGESVPVSKYPIELDRIDSISAPGGEVDPELSRHVVFCGTKIVRIRKTMPVGVPGGGGGEQEALGMVLRTGFNTTKGALVRSMLFPKPFGFAFYRDSFRFIGVLAIVAVCGFLASSVNFIKLGIAWSVILIRALDLITIVVPPALPATMSIGTSFAISRLRAIGIFCISPSRVNIAGKINIVCFDKTGTLTEEGLDVLGVRSVVRSIRKFTDLENDADNVPIFGAEDAKTPLLHALATCHALKIVDGEVIGDPLDLRMFEFTGWTLEEGKEGATKPKKATTTTGGMGAGSSKVPERAATLVQTVVRPPGGESFKLEDALKAGSKHAHFLELGVLRTFDFVSSLRRMSVLVKKLKSNSVEAYVKGAPEVMTEICDPATLPEDYEEMLAYYTKHGFRVIALAGKSMPGLTWIKAQRLKRDAVESQLRFLGIIIFENKLKPGTTPAISTLRSAHIPTRMVTGDNVRTAISVGRECGMILPHTRIYLPTFVKGNSSTPRSVIEWTDVEEDELKLDSYSLKPLVLDTVSMYSDYSAEQRDYNLAISGDVFRWMMDFGALETLQRMLVKGTIFARMSPDEKHELVERLQSLGYTVGFCGDGANDCGALKAADVGLSLSEAEASVAAPFTSRQPDIRCFIEVIKEGRAALVTSFSCFKFMALYSLIQFTTVTLLYAIASTLGDFQFLYIDLFLILPIAVTMGRTEAFSRIHPKRPTASLISKKVLTSLIGQIVITSGVQFFAFFYIRSRPWYVAPEIDPDELDIVSFENTALFLVSSFQYILVAAIFCVGPPYRMPIYTNRWLVLALVVLTSFSLYTLFTTTGFVFSLLQLISLPHDFHLELLILLLFNTAISFAFETYGAEVLSRWIGNTMKRIRRARGVRRTDNGKVYKTLLRSMD